MRVLILCFKPDGSRADVIEKSELKFWLCVFFYLMAEESAEAAAVGGKMFSAGPGAAGCLAKSMTALYPNADIKLLIFLRIRFSPDFEMKTSLKSQLKAAENELDQFTVLMKINLETAPASPPFEMVAPAISQRKLG